MIETNFENYRRNRHGLIIQNLNLLQPDNDCITHKSELSYGGDSDGKNCTENGELIREKDENGTFLRTETEPPLSKRIPRLPAYLKDYVLS